MLDESISVRFALSVAAASLATILSGWMAGRSLGQRGLPGCGAGSGCDAVTRGRWSRIGPLPVAVLGTIAYLALSIATVAGAGLFGPIPIELNTVSTVLLLIVIDAAAWFTLLQLLIIRRLCSYCLTVHLLACFAAALLLSAQRPWVNSAWYVEIITAIACVAALAIGQVFITPRTFAVTKMQPPQAAAMPAPSASVQPDMTVAMPPPSPAPPSLAPVVQSSTVMTTPPVKRRVKLLSGNIVLAVDGWPLLGRPDARQVIAVLFDFTCKECHLLRQLLEAAVAARPDWLAVALIPVPLDASCNPAITCKSEARAQACDYARLAWAVWLATDTHYAEWDQYVNADAEVRPYGLALVRANELADLRRFHLRDPDPLLDRAVGTGVGLYQASGKPKIPAILLPAAILNGHIPDLATLFRLLDAHLPRAAAADMAAS